MQTADLAGFLNNMPVVRLLAIEVLSAAEGQARLRLPFRGDLSHDGVGFQGGIIGALADFAGVGAAATLCRPDEGVATTGFHVHLAAPARGPALIAQGRVGARNGASAISHVEIFIEAAAGASCALEACAIATTTCRYLRQKPRPGQVSV